MDDGWMDGWISLSLHFLVSKMEIILAPHSQSHAEDEVRKAGQRPGAEG